ncbi:MAG: hypothetical protein CVU60_08965 [Deltaproteobacteria bacterium HGW-Deltaproteobacteria-18]|jgi:hypothetical protein|nr:MAG: hypothetical protein CVU60_08965 [Deltaproteobacteria bacterium HGW-Deltaproteobacteria-18]
MNTDQEYLQEAFECTDDDAKSASWRKPYVMIVPDEELIRHEQFREAVKQVLTQQPNVSNGPLKKGGEGIGVYKSLLTKSELEFLLK